MCSERAKQWVFAMHRVFVLLLGSLALTGCHVNEWEEWEEYDMRDDILTGEEARSRIVRDSIGFPESARNFYLWDARTIKGRILYWSFECADSEDCWKALEAIDAPARSNFQPWQQSRYAVVSSGPGFYFKELRDDRWNLGNIKNGVAYEYVIGNEEMVYYAIDFDRNRVYQHHYESGGIRTDALSLDR